MSDRELTVSDFAAFIGFSTFKVRRDIRAGRLRAFKLTEPSTGRVQYRLDLGWCIAYLEARQYDADQIARLRRIHARQVAPTSAA